MKVVNVATVSNTRRTYPGVHLEVYAAAPTKNVGTWDNTLPTAKVRGFLVVCIEGGFVVPDVDVRLLETKNYDQMTYTPSRCIFLT